MKILSLICYCGFSKESHTFEIIDISYSLCFIAQF